VASLTITTRPLIGVFQAPGAKRAGDAGRGDREEDDASTSQFPPGVSYRSDYDATIFVRESIAAVIHTLFEAIALVVLVVILFLQTWRASIIPLIAVPGRSSAPSPCSSARLFH